MNHEIYEGENIVINYLNYDQMESVDTESEWRIILRHPTSHSVVLLRNVDNCLAVIRNPSQVMDHSRNTILSDKT